MTTLQNTPSNRPSIQVSDGSPDRGETTAVAKIKGGDSYPLDKYPADIPTRISTKKLRELEERLGERDRQIIWTIRKYKFITTNHIKVLYFITGATESANTRAANKAMKKLKDWGLVDSLKRRVGGVRAGSSALIWHLTEAGYRLLSLNAEEKQSRKRFEEPSPLFLRHTLAVTSCAVQIEKICRDTPEMKKVLIDIEPSSWRSFMHLGRNIILKPDLYAITELTDYQDSWMIEIDLDSEPPAKIVEKCQTYIDYYRTGQEGGVFPLVVWIVPTLKRKEALKRHIWENIHNTVKMFVFITPDQFEGLLKQMISPEELC